ncbi:MAG TPA: superoxide dismutase [Caldithrix abyssi]|uniref:Superoxide dismutase n=1 Tax=Caldithrix abyssi TaxID=187145 RepID=A0A7V4WUZ0_CALAY|nr:superoxide dismutase [Caldithrix abyssi]
MKNALLSGLLLVVFGLGVKQAAAHCEIPCGIYNDELRIKLIDEDITTIEKSMKQIIELSKASPLNYNQIVRWVNNKDEHADKIQHIVTQYFMTQRIKLADPGDAAKQKKYVEQLSLLHELLVYAMKAKQTTDLQYIEKLRATLEKFETAYFGPDHKPHEHH